MIKCNVIACGTVSRTAQVRTSREGKAFLSLSMNVMIPAKSGAGKMLEFSVAKDVSIENEASLYPFGAHVQVTGVLTFRKQGEALYLNLSASDIKVTDPSTPDSIKGDMEFRGSLGKNIEQKQDKKGGTYCNFSAFSSEKSGTDTQGKPTFEYLWVRFVLFGEGPREWMSARCGIDVKGDLQMGVYNERLEIGCHVRELAEWRKQEVQPNMH